MHCSPLTLTDHNIKSPSLVYINAICACCIMLMQWLIPCVVHIKLTLIGIRSIMTHHVPRMKDNLICSTDCACCIMLRQWLTSTALHQNHIITSTVLSPYESYNVYRLVKWVTQLLTAPIATWNLYLDARFSRMTQPISQLESWPYTEKRLPLKK